MLQDRLVFQTQMEFGLRSRLGRTLELTRTSAAEVQLPDAAAVAAQLTGSSTAYPRADDPADRRRRYVIFVRGLLERMRLMVMFHPWLKTYVAQAGARRWPIWGGRPTGMPAFPRGLAAPTFVINGGLGQTDFDSLNRDGTWLTDGPTAPSAATDARPRRRRTRQTFLTQREVLATYQADGGSTVFALAPRPIQVHASPPPVAPKTAAG